MNKNVVPLLNKLTIIYIFPFQLPTAEDKEFGKFHQGNVLLYFSME